MFCDGQVLQAPCRSGFVEGVEGGGCCAPAEVQGCPTWRRRRQAKMANHRARIPPQPGMLRCWLCHVSRIANTLWLALIVIALLLISSYSALFLSAPAFGAFHGAKVMHVRKRNTLVLLALDMRRHVNRNFARLLRRPPNTQIYNT